MTDLNKPDYWKALNPALTIEGTRQSHSPIAFKDNALRHIADQLLHEGYIHEKSVISTDITDPLKHGLTALTQANLPAVFIYLYDEAWQLFANISPLISHFLGDEFRLLPNFWAWDIPLRTGASGWAPHIDCQADTRFKINKDDQILLSLSLWIPLSDATLDNGCMTVLPRSKESKYKLPIKDPSQIDMNDSQALPAPAGSILGWPQDLWHWSGSVNPDATHSRKSLSLEFQNSAFAPLIKPLLDINNPPPFQERLRLIIEQFSKYDHMETTNFDRNIFG